MTQRQFAGVAYEVVKEAFSIHQELGSLFDEAVYRNALVDRLKNAAAEVQIDVMFQDFHKSYFIDAVVGGGGIFEFKAVKEISNSHRSQLLNYLLLTGMNHGKLINFGPEQVEHEFVNTKLTHADRTNFAVNEDEWTETDGFGENDKKLFLDILHDWGTGLDYRLYRDALFHFLGGEGRILKNVEIFQDGKRIGHQTMPLCGDTTTILLTSFQAEDGSNFLQQLRRMIQAARLEYAQWINVAREEITFRTLHFSVPNFSVNSKQTLV